MILCLGLFSEIKDFADKRDWCTYHDVYLKEYIVPPKKYRSNVVQLIYQSCNKADYIMFVLDGIRLPLPYFSNKTSQFQIKSYTCSELFMILHEENLLAKTIFWCNQSHVDKNKVLSILSKENQDGLISDLLLKTE